MWEHGFCLCLCQHILNGLEWRAETDMRPMLEIENPLILPLKASKQGQHAAQNDK